MAWTCSFGVPNCQECRRPGVTPPAASRSYGSSYKEKVPAANRVFLNVRFTQKDEAKRLGARWCPDTKKWYADNRNALAPFSKFGLAVAAAPAAQIVEQTRPVKEGVASMDELMAALSFADTISAAAAAPQPAPKKQDNEPVMISLESLTVGQSRWAA